MQLLGRSFIYWLCEYLKSQWLGDFWVDETYKYFGTSSWLFDRVITPKSWTSKWISRDSFITINLKDFNQSCFTSFEENSCEKEIIKEYFDRNKNKFLKKAILEFYFKNNILFCPYCGLNQFQIILDDKLSSFDLDHFLPKDSFTNFWLSLYNLIPICKYCNQSLKWGKNPLEHWKNIFHPIWWWLQMSKSWDIYTLTQLHQKTFDDIFDCGNNWNGLSWEIFETNDSLYKHHLQFFRVRELYMQSPHLKNDINHIKNTYYRVKHSYASKLWLDKIKQKYMFQNLMEWWYPKWETDILQYSAWKLKKDIIVKISEQFK